jgi:uncharacterized protein
LNLPDFLYDGPDNAKLTIALAHGAGAPMDSLFMQVFAEQLGVNGYRVVRFEFPYMTDRRHTGIKKPPNRAPILIDTWNTVIDHFGPANLIIGGKSMGGRIASMVAAERQQNGTAPLGLICLGYPFHPPGKPENLRVAHLETLSTPTLICQGTRDTLGTKEDAQGYALSDAIRLHWLEDGDHGFKPRKKSGLTEDGNWTSAITAISGFAASLSK